MDKIALTGFTAFSTHSLNPTEILVNKYKDISDINAEVVPVSYSKSAECANRIEGKVLLMMGLSAGRKEISLEKFAWNERKASIPDNDGVIYKGDKIEEDGEERLETEIDIVEIERRLKEEGIPVYISTDPGRYVCNNIYYTALYSRKEPSLFVHFPETRDMSEEMEEKALDIIIGYLRETYLSDR